MMEAAQASIPPIKLKKKFKSFKFKNFFLNKNHTVLSRCVWYKIGKNNHNI